jgi:hypothetical protein
MPETPRKMRVCNQVSSWFEPLDICWIESLMSPLGGACPRNEARPSSYGGEIQGEDLRGQRAITDPAASFVPQFVDASSFEWKHTWETSLHQ